MKKEKGFKPKWSHFGKETGWKKTLKASVRCARLLASTDKRKTMHNRYLEAGRRIQALANVTKDKETSMLAKKDANYFFNKLK